MELDSIPQPELEQIERLAPADLVVGILDWGPDAEAGAALGVVREALASLPSSTRAVVVCNRAAGNGAVAQAAAEAAEPQFPAVVYASLAASEPGPGPRLGLLQAYHSLFAIGRRLQVRACSVVASQMRAVSPEWVRALTHPVLDLGFDLVAPRYTRHKLEGLLNRSILAPLSRALYGAQLQNPMGPDFGLSGKFLGLLQQQPPSRRGDPVHPVASIASIASNAASAGLQICEANLGVSTQQPSDWTNLSTLLAEILGPVFLDLEHKAAAWQRIRGSRSVPAFGQPQPVPDDGATVDVKRLIESFQLGSQNLQDVWNLVLPPSTMLEVKKLARMPAAQFRLPDELWAWIVYDFALGHRLRSISRDHLLRSFTPLYLGWIASFAMEMENAGPAALDAHTERLARAYEAGKPYLVSRWRWPDRFNP